MTNRRHILTSSAFTIHNCQNNIVSASGHADSKSYTSSLFLILLFFEFLLAPSITNAQVTCTDALDKAWNLLINLDAADPLSQSFSLAEGVLHAGCTRDDSARALFIIANVIYSRNSDKIGIEKDSIERDIKRNLCLSIKLGLFSLSIDIDNTKETVKKLMRQVEADPNCSRPAPLPIVVTVTRITSALTSGYLHAWDLPEELRRSWPEGEWANDPRLSAEIRVTERADLGLAMTAATLPLSQKQGGPKYLVLHGPSVELKCFLRPRDATLPVYGLAALGATWSKTSQNPAWGISFRGKFSPNIAAGAGLRWKLHDSLPFSLFLETRVTGLAGSAPKLRDKKISFYHGTQIGLLVPVLDNKVNSPARAKTYQREGLWRKAWKIALPVGLTVAGAILAHRQNKNGPPPPILPDPPPPPDGG